MAPGSASSPRSPDHPKGHEETEARAEAAQHRAGDEPSRPMTKSADARSVKPSSPRAITGGTQRVGGRRPRSPETEACRSVPDRRQREFTMVRRAATMKQLIEQIIEHADVPSATSSLMAVPLERCFYSHKLCRS